MTRRRVASLARARSLRLPRTHLPRLAPLLRGRGLAAPAWAPAGATQGSQLGRLHPQRGPRPLPAHALLLPRRLRGRGLLLLLLRTAPRGVARARATRPRWRTTWRSFSGRAARSPRLLARTRAWPSLDLRSRGQSRAQGAGRTCWWMDGWCATSSTRTSNGLGGPTRGGPCSARLTPTAARDGTWAHFRLRRWGQESLSAFFFTGLGIGGRPARGCGGARGQQAELGEHPNVARLMAE